MFRADFFSGNRSRLRELFTGTAPIVIASNGRMQRSGDASFPFHQDANFWYLTGLDEPDAVLVMDKNKEYVIISEKDDGQAAFDGVVSFDELSRISGIESVVSEKEGWKQLATRLHKVRHVATIAAPPAYIQPYSMFANPARARLLAKMKSENAEIDFLDISEHVVRLRMIKQEPELAAISKAISITTESLKESLRPSKRIKYAYEYEIEAEIYRGFRRRGSHGHAFDPIVASGGNATTIHYVSNSGALSSDELVVLDVGAEYEHYSADITRTIAIGEPTRRQQQIFDTVLDVQAYAYTQLKPGLTMRDFEQNMEVYMGEKLRELGLIKTIESSNVRAYYPHATSHHLGLNIHDVADYSQPLEPNMILTVEPGIYIPEEGIGIRIEDDVRITQNGIDILTNSLPASLN